MRPQSISNRLSYEQRQELREIEFQKIKRKAQGLRWYEVRPAFVEGLILVAAPIAILILCI